MEEWNVWDDFSLCAKSATSAMAAFQEAMVALLTVSGVSDGVLQLGALPKEAPSPVRSDTDIQPVVRRRVCREE